MPLPNDTHTFCITITYANLMRMRFDPNFQSTPADHRRITARYSLALYALRAHAVVHRYAHPTREQLRIDTN
jgi:hypothetical protein